MGSDTPDTPDVPGLFRDYYKVGQAEKDLHERVRQIQLDQRDDKLAGAVKATFEHIPQNYVDLVKKAHPKTAHFLLNLSEQLIEGRYGKTLQNAAMGLEDFLFTRRGFLGLMLISFVTMKLPIKNLPEILFSAKTKSALKALPKLLKGLEEKEMKHVLFGEKGTLTPVQKKYQAAIDNVVAGMVIDSRILEALIETFRYYLENQANPSSESVAIYLEEANSVKKAAESASKIKNRVKRNEAMGYIVGRLLHRQKGEKEENTERAIKMIQSMRHRDRAPSFKRFLERFLKQSHGPSEKRIDEKQIEEAIALAEATSDSEERDRYLQGLVSGLAKRGFVERALEVADRIGDIEMRAFAKSSAVKMLTVNRAYPQAIAIAEAIRDPGYREDSYSYIVKALLDEKDFDAAVQFVETVRDPIKKHNLAIIILTSMIANHDVEREQLVREKFSLTAF